MKMIKKSFFKYIKYRIINKIRKMIKYEIIKYYILRKIAKQNKKQHYITKKIEKV